MKKVLLELPPDVLEAAQKEANANNVARKMYLEKIIFDAVKHRIPKKMLDKLNLNPRFIG